jgi:ubiquitin carboxyl-terminal hydrolase 7
MCFLFSLRSKLHTYDDVVEKVAHQLGLDDPSKIRLTSHNCYSQQPKPQPIRYRGVEHLLDMLVHYNQVEFPFFFILRVQYCIWKILNMSTWHWFLLLSLWCSILQTSDILYYEVLDIPLPELQCLKTLKVAFHHATKDEVPIFASTVSCLSLIPMPIIYC